MWPVASAPCVLPPKSSPDSSAGLCACSACRGIGPSSPISRVWCSPPPAPFPGHPPSQPHAPQNLPTLAWRWFCHNPWVRETPRVLPRHRRLPRSSSPLSPGGSHPQNGPAGGQSWLSEPGSRLVSQRFGLSILRLASWCDMDASGTCETRARFCLPRFHPHCLRGLLTPRS